MRIIIFTCYILVVVMGFFLCKNPVLGVFFLIPLGIVDICSHARAFVVAERIFSKHIPTVRNNRTVETAAKKVLHNPNRSKSAKTKAGSALSQPRRTGK